MADEEVRLAGRVQGPAFKGTEWGADIIAAHRTKAATLRAAAERIEELEASSETKQKIELTSTGSAS